MTIFYKADCYQNSYALGFRSGPANLNSAISGNSGHIQGVSNGQEISKTHASHPQRGI